MAEPIKQEWFRHIKLINPVPANGTGFFYFIRNSHISKLETSFMYYTYILLSHKDNKFYSGRTNNLKRRFNEHQNGLVRSTKCRLPVELIFYEAYLNKYDSIKRERYFKTTKGKYSLKNMLKNYLAEKELSL